MLDYVRNSSGSVLTSCKSTIEDRSTVFQRFLIGSKAGAMSPDRETNAQTIGLQKDTDLKSQLAALTAILTATWNSFVLRAAMACAALHDSQLETLRLDRPRSPFDRLLHSISRRQLEFDKLPRSRREDCARGNRKRTARIGGLRQSRFHSVNFDDQRDWMTARGHYSDVFFIPKSPRSRVHARR